jgi:aflatoxin B1 aldehyde reductase
MPQANLKIVFGSMTFGPQGAVAARVHALEDQAVMLDTFQAHGYNEIDTARLYGGGETESMLSQNAWAECGLTMGTKLYPNAGQSINKVAKLNLSYNHTAEDIQRGFMDSLKALGASKIDLFYLHGPDRNTPYEDTLREVNKLHEEGLFTRFGLSNYMAWEVR